MKKIKDILKALGEWVKKGTRLVWMVWGLIVGLSSCNFYNACHSGIIAAIFYVVYYRIEYKKDHSWLTMVLVLLCSILGQGLIQILTEQ
jgi:hypothetical protein